MTTKRVLLGMSGGTDSSVAAMLLQEQGYEVTGITLKLYEETGKFSSLQGEESEYIVDARTLAQKLGIEHDVLDARELFKEKVLSYFTHEYLSGRTPFPCIACNREVKWKLLIEEADKRGIPYVSTGHYARITFHEGKKYITAAADQEKDQAFFLWQMTPQLLDRVIFPLGDYTKTEIRAYAAQRGFKKVSGKRDSMGICFIEGNDYRPFLKKAMQQSGKTVSKGFFKDTNGQIIGEHEGFPFYTVGQRRGLGIHLNRPVWVNAIDPVTNTVVVGDYEALLRRKMVVEQYNFIDINDLNSERPLIVKIRYRNQATPCRVTVIDENRLNVELLEELSAIAPGQSAVFYRDNRVIGGGIIQKQFSGYYL